MSREAVRRFGVELEGYLNKNFVDQNWYINGEYFEIKDDGSMGDHTDSEECNDCDGDGHVRNECENSDCEEGIVRLQDSDGNWYDHECKSCDGSGEGEEEECETCNGSGSITTGGYGLEIVSPPIINLELINDVYDEMRNYDWYVDTDAGLHIHVDAGDLTPKDFYKVLLLMTAVEPIIFSINDSFRYEDCEYCLPLSEASGNIEEVLRKPFDNIVYMSDVYFTNERYSALNFKAFRKHSTIEFRYFSPQKTSDRVIDYVELVTRLVDFAKHATYEQAYVVYDRIFNTKNFNVACDSLKEVLELPFDLKALKQNNLFYDIERVYVEREEEEEEAV